MDIIELQRRVDVVEAALAANRASERRVAYELDCLAEHLIGETAPELQRYKQRIQALVIRVDPRRQTSEDVEMYIETYCRHR